jgi:hypothetical protein
MKHREKVTSSRDIGIPGDKYRVEVRGSSYWVIDASTGAVMGGPWWVRGGRAREKAQQRADMLNMTYSKRH